MRNRCVLVIAAAVGMATACALEQPPPPSPIKVVASTKQVMSAITAQSDPLFNVGLEPPKTDEAWTSLKANAVIVAEAGNLLLLGDRVRDHGDWVKFSQAMTDAGAVALRAAESKNVDAASLAGDKLLETCSQCHEKYMK